MRKELPLVITFVVAAVVMLAGVTTGPIPILGIPASDIFGGYISRLDDGCICVRAVFGQ